ncbi:MAG: 1-acyl-sn-glycerol-3-phosphate acyltransferase [Propionibacteriales bacterium]|nr:1-acyl-sn-glycerol-3-phosphate acyltransferase [Propionibacteriales bacterium]
MRDLTYPPVIAAAKVAMKVMALDIHVVGSEHIPREGGAVLAFNHISYVDFIFGGFATQPAKRLVRFMSKRELFDHRLTGPLMRSLHHIEVDRDDGTKSYDVALDYLAAGEVVGLFPEATISRSFELKDFKTGTVRMAARADVPLIPVVLWGTQRIYTKDHPRDLSRGKAISLRIGPPIELRPTDPIGDNLRLREQMKALLDRSIREYPQLEDGAWWVPRAYGGTAPSRDEAATIERAEARARAERRRAERQIQRGTSEPGS